jgi:hypothetical protein
MAAKRVQIDGVTIFVRFIARAFDMNGYGVSVRGDETEVMHYSTTDQWRAPWCDRLGLTADQAIAAAREFIRLEAIETEAWFMARPELAQYR